MASFAFAGVGRADNGVPVPAHVVIVMEENHGYAQIIGSSSAPYINSLASSGALFTQSFAITHPSQPNYLAFFSGSTQGTTNDNVYPHSQFTGPNLAAKLLARGLTFGGYSETEPSVGYDGASSGTAPSTYQRKHNPWVNWQDATVPLPANKLPASVNMPFAGYFPSDFSTLPTLSFVIPNQLHDMHDGTVAQGDTWLQQNLSAYATWCQTHNSLLIVTFDEDDSSGTNQIATIFYGPMVATGQYTENITHYRVLRTIEDMFGLPHTDNTVGLTPITDVWAPCAPVFGLIPSPVVTCPSGSGAFSVSLSANAGGGTLSWQWQVQTGPGAWQSITTSAAALSCGGTVRGSAPTTASTSISITPCPGSPGAPQQFQLRCIVSNACGSATSAPTTYTVCPADFDCSGALGVVDIFAYLNAWFAADPRSEFDGVSGLQVADIFAFLNAWFAGC
jgi:hypothetical protein